MEQGENEMKIVGGLLKKRTENSYLIKPPRLRRGFIKKKGGKNLINKGVEEYSSNSRFTLNKNNFIQRRCI